MDSNGYVIVGGGLAADDDSFVPQTFPDPARPNNVIAPWWTDLNLAAAGGARLRACDRCQDRGSSHGSEAASNDCWLVVDWEDVPTFGSGSGPHIAHDFQIWIGLNGDAHAGRGRHRSATAIVGTGAPDGLNAGAENRDGSSGVNITPLPDGQRPSTSSRPRGPTPGGKVVITFDALGKVAGDYVLTARMTSNLTAGTTSARSNIHVGP